jgi:hypothetical protein
VRSFVITSVLALAVATDVRADPIAITSGFVLSEGASGGGFFEFNGLGFSAAGTLDSGVVGGSFTCLPCAPGDPIQLGAFWAGTFGNAPTAVVDGTTFSNVRLDGELTFNAPGITAPTTAAPFTVTSPSHSMVG